MMIIDILCVRFNVEYMKYTKNNFLKEKSYYDNDKFKQEIPPIKYVNFEYCNFPMEIDDDVNTSI